MKLRDISGVFRRVDIELLDKRTWDDDIVEFDFSSEGLPGWRPGEHGLFTLPGKHVKGKRYRGFSISSIPEEGVIKLATKISANPSSFKQVMNSLKPGESIRLNGPFGWFTLQDENSPIVMLASGVGITPIRALFKELSKSNKRFVNLIYTAKNEHLYHDELEAIALADERIEIHQIHSKEESTRLLNKACMTYGNTAYYYLSGAPSMLRQTRKKLKDRGIVRSHIITDPFFGY